MNKEEFANTILNRLSYDNNLYIIINADIETYYLPTTQKKKKDFEFIENVILLIQYKINTNYYEIKI